jgi:hypothetical protein
VTLNESKSLLCHLKYSKTLVVEEMKIIENGDENEKGYGSNEIISLFSFL